MSQQERDSVSVALMGEDKAYRKKQKKAVAKVTKTATNGGGDCADKPGLC